MSVNTPELDAELEPEVPAGMSLADRIAAREQEIAAEPEHAIIIPFPGKEDMLAVQYRALTFREAFKIEKRHEKNKDEAEGLLFTCADKLINACTAILEVTGPDEYKQTPYKLGVQAAVDLFRRSVPEGSTARQGLYAMFTTPDGQVDEEAIALHAQEYELQRKALRSKLDGQLEGESAAS